MISIYPASLILGAMGAIIISRFGNQTGLLDFPKSRSSHSTPTPKGGGIGIPITFVLVSLVVDMPVAFWVPGCIVALAGLWSDRVEFSPKLRLLVQLCATVILMTGMVTFIETNHPLFRCFVLLCWAVFIVGTTNFYNFMDGINGLASLTGFVAFGLLAIYLFLNDINDSLVTLSVCLCLSCLGFLPFNVPRAKVFLGDTGSIFLGFVFAALVYILSKDFLDFVCYTSLLFPFYIDELTTMVVRIKKGENLSRPHRQHCYQLLANEKGIEHWKVSLCYVVLQLFVGVSVLLMKSTGIILVLTFLGLNSLLFILASALIRAQVERG